MAYRATPEKPIVISGAGPVGLVLAIWLKALDPNLPFRIISNMSGPGKTTKATGLQARTLEYYEMLGMIDIILEAGFKTERFVIKRNGIEQGSLRYGNIGNGLTRYPFMFTLPQDRHEQVLLKHLENIGGSVEWNTELINLVECDDGYEVTTRDTQDSKEKQSHASFVVGCDGARSTVRKQARISFDGGTYDDLLFVADVQLPKEKVNDCMNQCFNGDELCMYVKLDDEGLTRIFGKVPPHLAREGGSGVTFDDVVPVIKRCTQFDVKETSWFSTYTSHHRVASHFQDGRRLFLCGDAAHVHSPVGGQGLNAGVGDASNLAWKLVAVSRGRAAPRLLDSYEPERIGFARTLVRTTDTLFQSIAAPTWSGALMRRVVMPYVLPFLWNWAPAMARYTFAIQNQLRIQYRDGPLADPSHPTALKNAIMAGDRIPYVSLGGDAYNYHTLRDRRWRVHVYGEMDEVAEKKIVACGLPLHRFAYSEEAKAQSLEKDAMYLLRPDGHVASVAAKGDDQKIADSMSKWMIVN